MIITALWFALSVSAVNALEYQQATGLIHMDSEVSGGENSIAMLAAVAKNANADMAIITDHDTQKATYGIWPLRKLLRVSHSRASVRKYGIAKYLDEIAAVDADLNDFVFLPGIEAVPYYTWHRDPMQNKWVLRNLHRHMLVMGLDKPEHIENLPSVEAGFPSRYTTRSLMGLLWFIPLIIAFILFKPPDERHVYYRNSIAKLFADEMNMIALPMMAVSIVFLIDAFPFKEPFFDQYGVDKEEKSYQAVIDYVNDLGGLVFWAHPEASYNQRISSEQGNPLLTFALRTVMNEGLDIVTDSYYHLLNSTVDYTGFAIFFEGYRHVGNPGGLWDSLLLQFCKGTRDHPVWAIAEIDMEEGTDPKTATESQTVFLVREKTKEEYLEALRKGRVYCFNKGLTNWAVIKDYSVTSDGKKAVSGEIVRYAEDAVMTFKIDLKRQDIRLNTVVIVDGQPVLQQRYEGKEPLTVRLPEPLDDIGYVRVVMYWGETMVVATNPIFFLK